MLKDKKIKNHPDLTRTKHCERSVGARLENLIVNINKYNLEQLKKEMLSILESKDTSISNLKREEYKSHMNRIYRLNEIQRFITNIYLASANMSLKMKKY